MAWVRVEDHIPRPATLHTGKPEEFATTCSVDVLAYDFSIGEISIAFYDYTEIEWRERDSGCRLEEVTHWQPLPQSPTIQQEA